MGKLPASYVRNSDNPCFGCVTTYIHPGCHDHCHNRAEYLRKSAEIEARIEAYIKSTDTRRKW